MKKIATAIAAFATMTGVALAQTPQVETGQDWFGGYPGAIGSLFYGFMGMEPGRNYAFGRPVQPSKAAPDECARYGANGIMIFDTGAGAFFMLPNTVTWCDVDQPGIDWKGDNVFTRSSN